MRKRGRVWQLSGPFVAGRYSCTWSSVDVGITKNGYELEFQFKQEAIDETDLYGATTVDFIYRGCDGFLSATCREYKAGSTGVMWQVGGAALGKIITTAVPIAVLATTLAKTVVLTSTAATPAAAAPATLTSTNAVYAPNYNPRVMFDSRLREVPIKLQLLPYVSSTDTILFSTT